MRQGYLYFERQPNSTPRATIIFDLIDARSGPAFSMLKMSLENVAR
jgi:hypothetical protein